MVSKRFLQTLILTAVFMISAVAVSAQTARGNQSASKDDLGTFIIKTETGVLIIHNREKDSYSLEFKGAEFDPHEGDHPVFTIDDKLVQIVSVTNNNFWKPKANAKNEPSDNDLLEAHKVWESEYLGGELNAKLSVTSEIFDIERKRKVMYWSFPMPKELGSDFSHQIFLTTLVGKDIIALNASPKKTGEQKAYRDFLVESMNTLKISAKPFNVKELQELLKKGDVVD
jgi:hypothetical protein